MSEFAAATTTYAQGGSAGEAAAAAADISAEPDWCRKLIKSTEIHVSIVAKYVPRVPDAPGVQLLICLGFGWTLRSVYAVIEDKVVAEPPKAFSCICHGRLRCHRVKKRTNCLCVVM